MGIYIAGRKPRPAMIGRLKKGTKKLLTKNQEGYGKDLCDRFRLESNDSVLRRILIERYGAEVCPDPPDVAPSSKAQPGYESLLLKELTVCFFGTPEEVCPASLKKWQGPKKAGSKAAPKLMFECDRRDVLCNHTGDRTLPKAGEPCLNQGRSLSINCPCEAKASGELCFIVPEYLDHCGSVREVRLSMTSLEDIFQVPDQLKEIYDEWGTLWSYEWTIPGPTRSMKMRERLEFRLYRFRDTQNKSIPGREKIVGEHWEVRVELTPECAQRLQSIRQLEGLLAAGYSLPPQVLGYFAAGRLNELPQDIESNLVLPPSPTNSPQLMDAGSRLEQEVRDRLNGYREVWGLTTPEIINRVLPLFPGKDVVPQTLIALIVQHNNWTDAQVAIIQPELQSILDEIQAFRSLYPVEQALDRLPDDELIEFSWALREELNQIRMNRAKPIDVSPL